jgi:hypothetical protein
LVEPVLFALLTKPSDKVPDFKPDTGQKSIANLPGSLSFSFADASVQENVVVYHINVTLALARSDRSLIGSTDLVEIFGELESQHVIPSDSSGKVTTLNTSVGLWKLKKKEFALFAIATGPRRTTSRFSALTATASLWNIIYFA